MDVRITLAFSNEMRITSSNRDHTTNLAKCTKMTEGEHRIHGMNGVSDSGNAAVKEEKTESITATPDTYNNLGGRLKFFKNGRFILELARAREGEKVAWVPVPKKTFWPPPGSTSSLSTYRQESSTSLSVSDDNSSIQSSPWQRDHTWKQTSPQRNISSNLNFYFVNNKKTNDNNQRNCLRKTCWQYKLQRAPYLIVTEQQRTKCSILNNSSNNKCNNSKCVNSNSRSSAISPKKTHHTLVNVVQFLWNKSLQTLNSITSPRKRILRELERVTIDDDLSIYNKRCRGKVNQQQSKSLVTLNHSPHQQQQQQQQQQSTISTVYTNNNKNNNNDNSNNISSVQNNRSDYNGCGGGGFDDSQQRNVVSTSSTSQPCVSATSGKNCSYSITSLLGGNNETNRDESKVEKLSSSQYITSRIVAPHTHSHSNPHPHPDNNSSPSPSVHSFISIDLANGPNSKNTVETIMKSSNKRSPIPRGRSPDSTPSPSTHYNYSAAAPPPPVTGAHHHMSHPAAVSAPAPAPPPPPSTHFMSPYSIYSSVLHHHHPAAAVASYITPYYHHQGPAAAAAAYAAVRGTPPSAFYQPLISQSPVHQPLAARHEPQYSSPWNSYEQHHLQASTMHRDDSDVPLNLSKHAD